MRMRQKDFMRSEEQSVLDLFTQGIRSEVTRCRYSQRLRYILCEVFHDILEGTLEERAQQLVKKSREENEWVLDLMISLSKKLRERTKLPTTSKNYLSPSTIRNYFKPLRKLLDMNNVPLHWRRVYATFPELDTRLKFTRGWTREEIQKMLDFTWNPETRAIILVVSSSGIRLGGLDFSWGDITPVYRLDGKLTLDIPYMCAEPVCAIVTIYRGSQWQYPALITPEAHRALMKWREMWKREVGREPKPDEPVFKAAGPVPYRPPVNVFADKINSMLKRAGLRTPLAKGRRNHDVPLMNGFRRFWNKTCKECVSKDSPLSSLIKKEFMMGHVGLVKLDRNYFKTNFLELAEEYLTVVPYLTITDEYRAKLENEKLKEELSKRKSNVEVFIEKLREDPQRFEKVLAGFS